MVPRILSITALILFALLSPVNSLTPSQNPGITGPASDSPASGAPRALLETPEPSNGPVTIEAAIITPYQSANVGAEIPGIVESVNFKEGDFIKQGQVVVELSRERYATMARKAKESMNAITLTVKRWEQEVALKQELLTFNGATRQELLQARTDLEIAQTRLKEAKEELRLAELNLEGCRIRAPFTGYLASRLKQPYEPVRNYDPIFAMVDASKVYAQANVPEGLLSSFKRGMDAIFENAEGVVFRGKIDSVGSVMDPKSTTKKVFVLIENTAGDLEIGSSGTLRIPRRGPR